MGVAITIFTYFGDDEETLSARFYGVKKAFCEAFKGDISIIKEYSFGEETFILGEKKTEVILFEAEKWNKRFNVGEKTNLIHMSHLRFTKTGLAGTAFYLTKDPILCYRSYCCSKNLKQPRESQRDGRISGRKLQELRNDIYNAELFEKLYPGYVFVDADPRLDMCNINEYGEAEKIDFPYITIRLYKKDSKYILRNKEYA